MICYINFFVAGDPLSPVRCRSAIMEEIQHSKESPPDFFQLRLFLFLFFFLFFNLVMIATVLSHVQLFETPWTVAHQDLCP